MNLGISPDRARAPRTAGVGVLVPHQVIDPAADQQPGANQGRIHQKSERRAFLCDEHSMPDIDGMPDVPDIDSMPGMSQINSMPDMPDIDSMPDMPDIDSMPDSVPDIGAMYWRNRC